uniref:Uncharacterized protein n=1 Tax=Sphaeramia orbicularis TaxID=375764 RepID=A0A673C850_9TELE
MCDAKRSHLPSNITAKVRASQFPDVLPESGGKLFCTHCNFVVEHKRKLSLDRHFSTVRACKENGRNSTRTEETSHNDRDWVATCTAVNIPLYKSDHPAMRRFLKEKVLSGGAIPGFHQLQEKYLGAVYQKEKDELKTTLDCTRNSWRWK